MTEKMWNELYEEHGTGGLIAILLIAILIVLPLFVLYEAWVITILWKWFAVPLGVSTINIYHAAGLSVLLTLMATPTPKTSQTKFWMILARPAFAFTVGAGLHYFM